MKTNLFQRAVNWCQGRTTAWLISFFICGNAYHIAHRLDATYISFMVTFMGIVLGHSVKEDYFNAKNGNGGASGSDPATPTS